MSMPKLAKTIKLKVRGNGEWSLLIDGEEFPWIIMGDDLAPRTGEVDALHLPTLIIAIPADKLEVEHDFSMLNSGKPSHPEGSESEHSLSGQPLHIYKAATD